VICRGLFALVIVPAAALLTKAQPVACTECTSIACEEYETAPCTERSVASCGCIHAGRHHGRTECGRSSGPGSQTQKQAPENLRTGLGISVASDEVLRVAVQLGVRDVVIYGGPGSGKVPGTDRKLNKPRADYQDYLELQQRLESHGLRLAAIEGNFVHLAKYHDIVFGEPRRDELIDELAAEIRDMGRVGVPAYMATTGWPRSSGERNRFVSAEERKRPPSTTPM
jgi:hypothetical protein